MASKKSCHGQVHFIWQHIIYILGQKTSLLVFITPPPDLTILLRDFQKFTGENLQTPLTLSMPMYLVHICTSGIERFKGVLFRDLVRIANIISLVGPFVIGSNRR